MGTTKQYITGFNDGYILARHEPGLLTKVMQGIAATNDYLEGFFSGSKQHALEYTQTQLEALKSVRNKANSREWERDR